MTQCPACGRGATDWSRPEGRERREFGSKRLDFGGEDRLAGYRRWRNQQNTYAQKLIVTDVDQIEWRVTLEGDVPVAVLELTRVDGNVPVPPSYLAAIDARYARDRQADHATHLARALGCEAYVVAFRHDLSEFWVRRLSGTPTGWETLPERAYLRWLQSLADRPGGGA